MDGNFLEKLYQKITDKLGAVAAFVPMIADKVKMALAEADADKVKAVAQELREAAYAQIALADGLDAMVDDDGAVSLTEGAGGLVLVEKWADEWEDVFKGRDEDDLAADPTG